MREYKYILNGRDPVPEPDPLKWGEWFIQATEDGSRIIAQTQVRGDVFVSTVFLGMDSHLGLGERLLLFETMVFREGMGADAVGRCSTWEEAEEMHQQALKAAGGEDAK